MALAHMAVMASLKVVLVSVNYHKRSTSHYDIQVVQSFANQHNLPCFVFDAYDLEGNFQAKARDFRYQKALEVAQEVKADVIMTAHHMDDHLETYLWQLKRNHKPLYYGIKPTTWLQEFELVRPLLELSKQDLIQYNQLHSIDYVMDESNEQPVYTRNIIRQSILEMSEEEKQSHLLALNKANDQLETMMRSFEPHISAEGIDVSWFKTLTLDEQHRCLRFYLNQHKAIKASEDALNQFVHHLDHNDYHQFFSPVYLMVHRGWIKIFRPTPPLHLKVMSFDELQNTNLSAYNFELSTIRCQFFETDFPIILRYAKAKDRMQIKIGRKKVFNWLSEKKIPRIMRQSWMVIENAEKKIIYVKGWGADMVHRTNIHP